MISFEILEGPEALEQVQAYWGRLFDTAAHEASLSLEWTRALLETHLRGDSFLIVVLKRSDEVVGVVPLCIQRSSRFGLPYSKLFPIAEYFNTHSDLLLAERSDELLDAFLKAIVGIEGWDTFWMGRFVETSPLLDGMVRALGRTRHLRHHLRREEPSFFIELRGSYDDFLAGRSANFRSSLKRASKKLSSLGRVTFVDQADLDRFDPIFDTILDVEAESWKHQHGTAITSTERSREFYRWLCRGAFEAGRLRFSFLCLEEVPIAFEMGLLGGDKYYCVHGSYRERFKDQGPGRVLLARFLEGLIRDGITEYDFFGEPFEWESRWTDKYRWHRSLTLYNRTPRAALMWRYHALRRTLGKSGECEQLVLRDPRDIRPPGS